MKKNTFIISLGGSLMVPPTGINWRYLKKFRSLILKHIRQGRKFYIITGGGATCRDYIHAAQKVVKVPKDDLDWLGIHSTRLNAHLLRTIFKDVACPEVIKNPTIHLPSRKKLIIAAGWKPGWSTDYVAAMLAQEYEIGTIINLTNISYVYTADPKTNKNAKLIKNTDWTGFRKIVGSKWTPGLNAPFDPIASRKASQLGLRVIITNGRKLKNLDKILKGEKYRGTTIE